MPDIKQALNELFELQLFAIKLGLENITALCNHLNNPQKNYPVIHLAGTNGKGSTAFFIYKLLMSHGLKTGLYTSPHIRLFNERIRVNDLLISDDYIVDFWTKIKKKVYELKATFFDTTTALAFDYFRKSNVDIAVIETGLGGRLDSTNIVSPKIAIITPIDFDHQKQLGNSIKKITREKAGIIKKETKTIISSKQRPTALKTLKEHIFKQNFYYTPDQIVTDRIKYDHYGIKFRIRKNRYLGSDSNWFLPYFGTYQKDNFSTALLATLIFLSEQKIKFKLNDTKEIIHKSVWPGRTSIISAKPFIIADVSHNYHGINKTIKSLSKFVDLCNALLLFGTLKDKSVKKVVSLFDGNFKKIIITEPETDRKLDVKLLSAYFVKQKANLEIIKDFSTAYELSQKELKTSNYSCLILIGSHFLIGDIANKFDINI